MKYRERNKNLGSGVNGKVDYSTFVKVELVCTVAYDGFRRPVDCKTHKVVDLVKSQPN